MADPAATSVVIPAFDEGEWRCVEKREAPPEADPGAPRYTFRTLERA